MKRRKLAICTTLLIIIFIFTACDKKNISKKDSSKTNTSETEVLHSESKNKIAESESKSSKSTSSELETEQQNMTDSNILKGYSDSQIEYARVWLTLKGDYMLSEEGVTFHAERIPKGTPIFPELSENATYDNDVVKLYGDRSIDTPLVYSSNHDGSIQLYSFPSSWTSTNVDATDKDAVEKYAEDVVKTTRTVTIPEGNPTSVKEMIELLN